MSRVSVLVAVYNAASYLPACLDSLRRQTLADLQIICVDDASTDNSLAILQRYAAEDERFTVLKQPENGGQAKARNRALQIADGDYVAMLDADDWFAPDALQQAAAALDAHSATDCVLFRLVQHFNDTGEECEFPIRTPKTVLSGTEAMRLSLDWRIHGLYLVRTALHKRYPFDESCRLYSDDNTTRLHFLHSREVRFCSGAYYYRKHAASCTNAITLRRFDYMEANLSMKHQLEAERVPAEVLNFYELHRWLNLVGLYWFYYQHKTDFQKDKKEIFARMATILRTIEPHRIPWRQRCKLGYIPVRCFALFRGQEEFYFRLRHLLRGI